MSDRAKLANEHHVSALAAFEEAVTEGFEARLVCEQVTPDAPETAEISVELTPKAAAWHTGLLHEEIVAAVALAERHGARLWLQKDEPLSIVWPLRPDGGPGPVGQESPANAVKRAATGGARS